MKNDYPHIFSPLTVKNMTIKNRIVMMPMGTNYGEQNGEMSFLHINYYEQRAKGGTGLIIVENASIDSPQGSNGTTQLRIDHDNYLPRLFKFCENIHRYGTKIAIQINHAGASAVSSRINMQPVSASDVPSKEGGEIPRPLSKDEILHIVKKYGEAAKRAQTAGFDAVEIHAGHSYLISQFLSPTTNKRTDEFGGSVGGGGRYDEMIGKFTGQNTSACGFSIGFERIVMLLLERGYEIPTKNGKKAYLIEKNMPADKLLPILKQAEEERKNGVQVNISIMKKNKKFQKEQMTAEGYTEFVEFFNK